MSRERLQKVLAGAGFASRRKAEDVIAEGRVEVNGKVATLGDKVDPRRDAIKVDGKRIHPHLGAPRHYLLNKPDGVVSTRSDPEGRRTLLDLVPKTLARGLKTVGRLDYHTEGLILLTDDGDLAQRVAHPRHGCVKIYEVKVQGEPDESQLERVRSGMVIDGKRTAPAVVRRMEAPKGPRSTTANSWLEVRLGEGRTRQIREMMFRIGHPVKRLRRVAIGPLRDPHLPPGAFRELTDREVAALDAATRQGQGRKPTKKGWAKAGGGRGRGRGGKGGAAKGGGPPAGGGRSGKKSRSSSGGADERGRGSGGRGGRGGGGERRGGR